MSAEEMVNITINNIPLKVAKGTKILEAARKLNIDIPHLCYHPDQRVKAHCRICSVEVTGKRRLLADTRVLGGMPDGATVSADGRLWVAINPGGKVAAYRPDGSLDQVIDLPTARPGSVAFGGTMLNRLFVTSLDPLCFGEPADEAAGYLYVIDGLNVCGLVEPRYRN